MQPQTLATIEQLKNALWFSVVGTKDSHAVAFVSDWAEAIARSSSVEWENLCTEAANQYRARVAERAPERLVQWNEIVSEVKAISVPLVKSKIAEVVKQNGLPSSFEDVVQWDILHLCMESEYADVFPPGFYASQAYWYLKGHFPCGWDGEFPDGKLLVY